MCLVFTVYTVNSETDAFYKLKDRSGMSLNEQCTTGFVSVMGHACSIGNRLSARVAMQTWAKLHNQIIHGISVRPHQRVHQTFLAARCTFDLCFV